jgi:tetratricopeptide (TPR) repeat protein
MRIARKSVMLVGLIASLFIIGGLGAWWFWPARSSREEFERGMEAVDRGDWGQVLDSAERLGDSEDFAAHERLLRGIHDLRTGRLGAAMHELGSLKPEGELREPVLLAAGEVFYRTGRLAEARQLFGTIAVEQPGHVDAHRWLGAIAYDLGALNQAMDELEIVVRLKPGDYRPYLLKGHILYDQELFPAAIDAYSRGLAAKPPREVRQELLILLARARLQAREYVAALDDLANADRTAQSLALQAECELSLGRTDDAWARIKDAIERDSGQLDVLRMLARLNLDARNATAAIAPLRQLLDHDPHDHESRHQYSQALRLLGKTAEAQAESRLATRSIELKLQLSSLNLKAIEHPADPDVRDEMARVCEDLGKVELAATWRQAAAACRQTLPTGGKFLKD